MAEAAREKHIEEQHKAGFKLRVSVVVFVVVFVAINHPPKKQTNHRTVSWETWTSKAPAALTAEGQSVCASRRSEVKAEDKHIVCS